MSATTRQQPDFLSIPDDDPTPSTQQLYCVCCGHLITDAFDCPGFGGATAYTQLTCWQPGCLLVGATTSDKGLLDDGWLKAWHVERRFNQFTGERVK